MYSLRVDIGVLKELRDPQQYLAKIYRQITLKIFSLEDNPRPPDSKRIGGGYRVDTGEYRILYEVDDSKQIITVRLVGPRNDDAVYERARRMGLI